MDIKLTTNSIIHCTERQQYNAVTHILHRCGYEWNDYKRMSLNKHCVWSNFRESTVLIVDVSTKTVDYRNINSDWFSDPDYQYPIMNAIDFLKLHDYKIPSKLMSCKYLYAVQTKENENFITAKINNNTTKNSENMDFEELQNKQRGIIKHFEEKGIPIIIDSLPTDVYYHGDPLRGNEVIAALEKLGGINYRSCCSGENEERLYYISKENNYITNCLPRTDKELASFITRFYKMLTLPPIEIIEVEGKKYRKEEVLEKLKNLKTY